MRSIRLSPDAYRRITLFALLALAFIIVTGGAVRLTGSGLGCTDWPTCEQDQFVAPLEYHAWVEFGNRLITGLVSVAVILAVLGSFVRVPRRRDLTWLSVGLVVGVLAQIILGAVVVKTHLVPAAVSAHFLVSMALVWNAVVLHERAGQPDGPPRLVVPVVVRNLATALVALTVAVLFVGTLVTGAGPHSGDPGEVDRLSLEIREVVRVHGLLVVALLALTVVTLVALYRSPGAPVRARRRSLLLIGALLVQAAIGYTQYFNGVPALLVGAHILGAVLVWIAVLSLYESLYQRVDREAEQPQGRPQAGSRAGPRPATTAVGT